MALVHAVEHADDEHTRLAARGLRDAGVPQKQLACRGRLGRGDPAHAAGDDELWLCRAARLLVEGHEAPLARAGGEAFWEGALERPAVGDVCQLVLSQLAAATQAQQGDGVLPGQLGASGCQLAQLLQGHRALQAPAPHLGAAQGAQVRAATQALAQVARDGADVGSLAHLEVDVPVWQQRREAPALAVVEVCLLEARLDETGAVDAHAARLELELLALARRLVGGDAVLLDGAVGRGQLHGLALDAVEQLLGADAGKACQPLPRGRLGVGGGDAALGVVCVCGGTEDDARGIALVMAGEVGGKPRGGPHAHEHEPGGHGVEGAGMPHAALAGDAAHGVHNVVRADSLGFVHGQDAAQATPAALHRASPGSSPKDCATRSTTVWTASSMGP